MESTKEREWKKEWPVRTLGVRNSKGKGERESLKERKGGRSGSTTSWNNNSVSIARSLEIFISAWRHETRGREEEESEEEEDRRCTVRGSREAREREWRRVDRGEGERERDRAVRWAKEERNRIVGEGGLSRCRGGKEDWGDETVNERGHNGVEESEGFKIIVEHRGWVGRARRVRRGLRPAKYGELRQDVIGWREDLEARKPRHWCPLFARLPPF